MIPKIIHYCWFGHNPLPESALKCIKSWKKYCPDYEIKQWDESNFDIDSCNYTRESYSAKKWAFVSDYARMWILYNYGGLYFDTDVELIADISDIVEKGPFMGSEPQANGKCMIAAGLGLGVEKGHPFYKKVLEHYENVHFIYEDGYFDETTIITRVTSLAVTYGYKCVNDIESFLDITVYPPEYFCPLNMNTGIMNITDKTKSIHWYSASWKTLEENEIHRRCIAIQKKIPGKPGIIIGFLYEISAKCVFFTKTGGLKSTIRRIFKKIYNRNAH